MQKKKKKGNKEVLAKEDKSKNKERKKELNISPWQQSEGDKVGEGGWGVGGGGQPQVKKFLKLS